MKVDVSIVFALCSSPFVVASYQENNDVDRMGEAMRDIPGLVFAMTQELAQIELYDPDTMEESGPHRELQLTADCNATYSELWKDQALNDAYDVYSAGWDEAAGSLSADACAAGSDGTFACNFTQTVDGESEFTSACTTVGGEIYPISLDLSCSASFAGQSTNAVLDLPPLLQCIPSSADFASCTDQVNAVVKNITDVYTAIAEGIFAAQGLQDAKCTTDGSGGGTGAPGGGETGAPGGGETGAPGGGETGAPGGGETSAPGGGGGGSSASSLGLLFAFGLMTIVSLTLG